jgi:hypothetical protein
MAPGGGTVVCLDAGPYTVSLNIGSTSETYDCPGIIQFGSGSQFSIGGSNASVVRFRNVTFDGTGGAIAGIVVTFGNPTVICENCKFQNFTSAPAIAIVFKPTSPGAQLILIDTVFENNGIAPCQNQISTLATAMSALTQ